MVTVLGYHSCFSILRLYYLLMQLGLYILLLFAALLLCGDAVGAVTAMSPAWKGNIDQRIAGGTLIQHRHEAIVPDMRAVGGASAVNRVSLPKQGRR